MACAVALVPQISISLAPPDEPSIEPYSPFSLSTPISRLDDGAFRPIHLTPPPTLTRFSKQLSPLSPLRPHNDALPAKGLERERFEALLQASRERNSAVGVKKAGDLRKEIALKAHKNKQGACKNLNLSNHLTVVSQLNVVLSSSRRCSHRRHPLRRLPRRPHLILLLYSITLFRRQASSLPSPCSNR